MIAAVAAAASVHVIPLGRSARGRSIDAIEVAAPNPRVTVLVVGCIHGNEPAGIASLARSSTSRRRLSGALDRSEPQSRRVAGTRQNARRRRSQPQLPVALAGHGRRVRLGRASALGAGVSDRVPSDPAHPPDGVDLVPPAPQRRRRLDGQPPARACFRSRCSPADAAAHALPRHCRDRQSPVPAQLAVRRRVADRHPAGTQVRRYVRAILNAAGNAKRLSIRGS